MTEFLIGGYGADMGGTATGVGRARSHPDGRFEYLGAVAEAPSPSWVAVAGTRVFATLEGTGEVASWRISDPDYRLIPITRVGSGGTNPCHLAVIDGIAIVASYTDGAVAVVSSSGPEQVLAGSGSGPLEAQEGPHAHHVLVLDDGRVLTADLGADLLHVHTWADSRLTRTDSVPMPSGTGPRDLLVLPDGRLAVLGEWSCDVVVLEERGDTFEVVQIVGLPGATPGVDQAAALGLSADGRHVFAGIRGSNRVATLLVDDTLSGVGWVDCGGAWPRHLVVDGDFVHVANQLSSTVTSFRIGDDGTLTSVGEPAAVPSPTCLAAIR